MYQIQYQTPSQTHQITFDHKPSPEEARIAMFALVNTPSLCALVLPKEPRENSTDRR